MIFHTRTIPFGFYQYPSSTEALTSVALSHEEEVLRLDRNWATDRYTPTSARYRNYNFLRFPNTAEFKLFLHSSIDDFYKRLNWPIPTHRWLQCWMNVHRKGQYLDQHVHHGCRMSGHMTLACLGTRTTYFNNMTLDIENEPGLLTLIGASMVPHQTSPVEDEQTRISVAFDVFEAIDQARSHWVRLEPDA